MPPVVILQTATEIKPLAHLHLNKKITTIIILVKSVFLFLNQQSSLGICLWGSSTCPRLRAVGAVKVVSRC